MGKKRHPYRQKVRTREHIVGDLAVNHVQRQVLLAGWTVEPISRDYGLDLVLFTFDEEGQLEDDSVYLQVKGTEEASVLARTGEITFRVEQSDLRTWLRRTMPVILIVYDVSREAAFWLHVQEYFTRLPGFDLASAATTLTVRIPPTCILTPDAVRSFAVLRDAARS